MDEEQDRDLVNKHAKGGSLAIIVKPNSPKNRITYYDGSRNALRVDIKAHPEDGKANIEVIKFFSRLTKKDVKIIKGHTSKNKVLKFE
jgi:uncharacterized protein